MDSSPAAWESFGRIARNYTCVLLCWLAVGFSLGWYYTFTYYGRTGWPMPTPEPCAAILLYYFSVLNVATEIQAVHWMLVFPCAGALWAGALHWTAKRLDYTTPLYHDVALRLALASLPLAAPGGVVAWLGGQTPHGFDMRRMAAVALRHGYVSPPGWMTPLYFALGLVALGLQLVVYRRLFPVPSRRALLHWPAAAVVLFLVCIVAASLVSYPLRFAFE